MQNKSADEWTDSYTTREYCKITKLEIKDLNNCCLAWERIK